MRVSSTIAPGHDQPGGRRLPLGLALVMIWSIPAAIAVLETYTFARMSGRPSSLVIIVLREGATWATYGCLAPLAFQLANRFPLRPPTLRRRLALHFGAGTVMGAIAAVMGSVAMRATSSPADLPQYRQMTAPRLFLSWFLGGLPVALLSYFAVVGVAHAVRYFREAQQRREDALRLEGQLAEARLAALQGRLHPHFLYNTLNAITVLVRDGEIRKSTRMLELLGTMLRRVLDGSLPQVVSLATELALLRQYLDIEEVRFSDRLTVTIDVDESAMSAGVPALIMQPLAENVIRHSIAHTSQSVILRVVARVIPAPAMLPDTLELSIEDDGPGLAPGWELRRAQRTGLAATTLRLDTLYGSAASLRVSGGDGGGVVSMVRIPYSVVTALDPDRSVGVDGPARELQASTPY